MRTFPRVLLLTALCLPFFLWGQPCLVSNTFTASTPPVNGTYACGETVTFCFTVTNWASTSANWFHGVAADFGPGWDVSTLVPSAPPASCSGSGTWGWYNSVLGTAGTNIGPQGPGFFYDFAPGDGNPGNNFGDFCTGAVSWTFCWTISVLSGPACVNGLDLSVSVNSFGDSETGSWGSTGCTNDPIVVNPPTVIQSCSADAGSGSSLSLCGTAPPSNLFSALGGTPNASGVWSDPTGQPHSGLLDPASDQSGNYTYTVTSVSPPCTAQAIVAVSVLTQPEAGTNGTLDLCASSGASALFAALGGTPSSGGIWTAPNGTAHSGTVDPAQDPSGNYTYTLAGAAPCVSVSSVVAVTILPAPNAGSNGSLSLCSSGSPALLFGSLGGTPDAGGTWTGPDGLPFNGTFSPSSDMPGIHTYTVQGTAPCPSSTGTVNVQLSIQPNAGSDGPLSILCSSEGPVALIGLLGGTPDPGGTWTNPNGGVSNGTVAPGSAQSGTYTYFLSAPPPCVSDAASVEVVITSQPSAGTGSVLTVCDASSPLDLFAALAGSPGSGGTWSDPNSAPIVGIFDPAADPSGAYTYTIAATTPCVDVSAVIDITVAPQPNAGDDATLAICSTDETVDLFTLLGASAQPNGTWTDPNGLSVPNILQPMDALNGTYSYTVPATAPCMNDEATVEISSVLAGDPGLSSAVTACSSDPVLDLFDQLLGTPQPGGTWTGPQGPIGVGTIAPQTASSGTYTYTLAAIGPCPAFSATVDLAITNAASAGVDGTLSVCDAPTIAYPLIQALGGAPNPGGSWFAPDGTAHGVDLLVGTDPAGPYSYQIPATGPCPAVISVVDVTFTQAPDPGIGGDAVLCEGGSPIDPMTWLTGSPDATGNWTSPNGSTINLVDPAISEAGIYTYTVPGTAPCVASQVTVQVSVDQLPDPGVDAELEICTTDAPIELFGLLGNNAENGGNWTGPTGAFVGEFDPSQHLEGIYTYAVVGEGACVGSMAEAVVVVSVRPPLDPVISVDALSGCAPLLVELSVGSFLNPVSASWSFGDGGNSLGSTEATHIYSTPGSFEVTVLVTDDLGCIGSSTFSELIRISDGPDVNFGVSPSRVSVENPVVDLILSDENPTRAWSIDGMAWVFDSPYLLTIPSDRVGEHVICLTAADEFGCANEHCEPVILDDVLTIYVANAFTPNGDNLNESFTPSVIGFDPEFFLFKVFDRWGVEVFHSDDPMIGWNGAFRNSGELMPQDVYIWRLWVKEGFSTERRKHFGTVTLLK